MFSNTQMSRLLTRFKARHDIGDVSDVPHIGSDMEANDPSIKEFKRHEGLRNAAVLVPIIEKQNHYSVLLTKRCDHLPDHPGQVSFPGGSRENADRDDIETALRETEEEVGIARKFIDTIGCLKPYYTVTGFKVAPVVGLVGQGFSLNIDTREVDHTFEVPLDFFLDFKNHERHSKEFKGQTRYFYAMPYDGNYIWGATAAMLVNLSHVLYYYSGGLIEDLKAGHKEIGN